MSDDDFVRTALLNAAVDAAGIATAIGVQSEQQHWFSGAAIGTFDGFLHFVDLRGALPEIKLTLSAGGKQIDCVCRDDDVETIRGSLNKRVRITGRAIYDGRSGLPRRVEVISIAPVGEPADFTKWRGSFEPFTAPEWPGDVN